ncbi:MAG TPA: Rieske 2Fe-2S domain-containing protein [Candidatus Limnocylindrales bacterium]|nr:Rieske 2Fe-2S domain-containing protein [Candidatus Limnocylindrales bacterium]
MLHRAIDRLIERQRWMEPVADTLQRVAAALFRGGAGRAIKTLLNGTWFGHPLHPAITDIPLGAFTLAVLFDILHLLNDSAAVWRTAANVAIAAGLLAALGALVTGYADWSDTIDRERRVGLTHGLLNAAVTVLYLVSFAIRMGGGTAHGLAIVIAWVGYALLIAAAYLGGELVFSLGTGVNHHAWEEAITEWMPALRLSDLPEATPHKVYVRGTAILLYRKGGTVCAISNTCSHAGGPLNEGTVAGDHVICPWHASRFDLCTGRVKGGPATVSQVRYETRIQDGQIEVRRSAETFQAN